MILPKKHLSIQESLFGYGAFLLGKITEPISMDSLWKNYQEAFNRNEYPVKFSFDQFLVTIDYLFMINAINLDEGGMIYYAVDKTISK